MFDKNIKSVLFIYLLFACVQASGFKGNTQDITTPRANTLSDDADDIQRQLDNEAKDRLKLGKNLMVRAVTDVSRESSLSSDGNIPWDYKGQKKWGSNYPNCGGRSQSPVDLPYSGFLKVTGAQQILFRNHNAVPRSLSVTNDGKNIRLSGSWLATKRPMIHRGAAYSRRYVFDSILLHWPSEHTINGLQYPIESQALYVSAEYASMEEALKVTNDNLALLGVTSLYKFSNHTHKGLETLMEATLKNRYGSTPISRYPLEYFNPPMKEYACYQGSLTSPPCTESVLWLVRARSLPVSREYVEELQNTLMSGESEFLFRQTQPLNDRKVYFFN